MRLRLDTTARRIDVPGRKLMVTSTGGGEELLSYDKLVVGTGAASVRPPISGLAGLGALGAADGVHLLHSMGDTSAVMQTLEQAAPRTAVIVGAGYIGLEMADALTVRGLRVTQMEQPPEVLPTVDPQLGALVHAELAAHGVAPHLSRRPRSGRRDTAAHRSWTGCDPTSSDTERSPCTGKLAGFARQRGSRQHLRHRSERRLGDVVRAAWI
jgi:pyruvate/2-oxoglutarate dehydrogenase complex dihydrolipoamide dehydrogenase (E3) component